MKSISKQKKAAIDFRDVGLVVAAEGKAGERITDQAPLRLLIPANVWERVGQKRALLAEWEAGPGEIARGRRIFEPPATVERACAWLERYQGAVKACSILIEDRSVVRFNDRRFLRYDHNDNELRKAGTFIDTLKSGTARISMSARVPETALSRPFDRSYWVADGKLQAGCYPGQQDEEAARAQISRMIDFEVTHFVNLMHSSEKDHAGHAFRPYEGMAREIASLRGVEVTSVRFPIRDMDVPSVEEMTRILDNIDAKAQAGQISYVHCWGGMGRTGTVVGCWLARHGTASGEAALDLITELRQPIPEPIRGDSPQTDRQREMVRKWTES